MLLMDVNVLVYAHRAEVPDHGRYRRWVEDLANGDEAFGLSETVLCGFLRIVTHPKVFTKPWKISLVLYRQKEEHAQLLEYDCFLFANAAR